MTVSVERRIHARVAVVVALCALMGLNLADVLVTRQAVARGLSEANPVGRLLLGGTWAVFAVKLGAPAVAVVLVLRARRVTVAYIAAVWAVVGFYASVVTLNAVALASA